MTRATKRRGPRGASALMAALALALIAAAAAEGARVKDITHVQGIRTNPLYGFGLVVGLAGTGGDSDFTSDVLENVLDSLRVGRGVDELDTTNVAAVIVTADLPPFAKLGSTIDVTVSALDETTSLRGGQLLLTPLTGADGAVYAVAQGAVSVGGFAFSGAAATVQQGHPTVGRIPNGANVERTVATHFLEDGALTLTLHTPDFATASRIAEVIESRVSASAEVADPGTVRVQLSTLLSAGEAMERVAEIGTLPVNPDVPAVVIINERTGTVVAGQRVGISSIAISHGTLTVVTEEFEQVSQPGAFARRGRTATVDRTAMSITESPLEGQDGGLTVLAKGTTVSDVARALNLLGASPRDIISIFQAMKEAGALHAELRIM